MFFFFVMQFLFVNYLDAIGWRENISGTVKIVDLCNVEDVIKRVIAKIIVRAYIKCVAWWLKEKVSQRD